MPGGGARGQNLEHLKNLVYLRYKFLEVYILTTISESLYTYTLNTLYG